MTNHQQPLIKLPASICQQHNLPYETYCSHQNCSKQIRVCPKCKPNHSTHTQKFFTPSSQVISDLTTGLKRCFDKIAQYDLRTIQLTRLINSSQTECKQQYQKIQLSIIEQIKQDKKVIQKKILKMEQIHSQLEKTQRIKTYFSRIHQSSLLLLKIKLSNQNGMLQLKQKNQKLCQVMAKHNLEQTQKLYSEFNTLNTELYYELQNSFTFRLGQIIALKNSKKIVEKNQSNRDKGKENNELNNRIINKEKEKNKPKTMTNFGQGIISGILNFLNL